MRAKSYKKEPRPYRILVAREISEYAEIEVMAKSAYDAKIEARRILTEQNDLLDGKWDIGNETQGERVCWVRKVAPDGTI